ncbi:tetratricopeptide repeat protein [Ningiella sp. W23]|uniref:tetratricopeptide repeat protein n=1 Tax=Ningiella sp. W23 TaxID=3023715 RepID=UPI0037563E22
MNKCKREIFILNAFRTVVLSLVCLFSLASCALGLMRHPVSIESEPEASASPAKGLSEIQREQRQRLLAGKSSRPGLSSLNLMPQARGQQTDTETSASTNVADIPRLSLLQKQAEYESLLPLVRDEQQRRQIAYRLADIKMEIAEIALMNADDSASGNLSEAIDEYQRILAQPQTYLPDLVESDENADTENSSTLKQMDAMYQLARALDLSGKQSQSVEVAKNYIKTFSLERYAPNEQHLELFFRIGEYYFNRQDFETASGYYRQVIDTHAQVSLKHGTDFYAISAYMLGWSEFKRDSFDEALYAFDLMLAHTFNNDVKLQQNNILSKLSLNGALDDTSLSKGELRLLKDSLRIMALTFSYQGSGQAILDFYAKGISQATHAQQGQPAYSHLIFEELAQQYLDEDRYTDSASVLLAFAQASPAHPRAVEFYVRHIDAYLLGGFSDEARIAKNKFVDTYSLGNGVLTAVYSPIADDALPYLRRYLQELAQTEHHLGQHIDAQLKRMNDKDKDRSEALEQRDFSSAFASEPVSGKADDLNQSLANASEVDLRSLRTEAYEQAISHYENFINTFSKLPQNSEYQQEVSQLRFYMAEAYFALEQYPQAISAFERYAYMDDQSDQALAAEAAYAAILAHEGLTSAPPHANQASNSQSPVDNHVSEAIRAKQQSQARFVLTFYDDKRSPLVASNLMHSYFAERAYIQAQKWAAYLLGDVTSVMDSSGSEKLSDTLIAQIIVDLRDHPQSSQFQQSASLVMAHSLFEQGQYAQAESYYRELLDATVAPDKQQTTAALATVMGLEISALQDRLAAAIYKQAEQTLAQVALSPQDISAMSNPYDLKLSAEAKLVLKEALAHWARLIKDVPTSSFRSAAQYDSAVYFAMLGNWQQAIELWLDFSTRFADSPLNESLPQQLLFAYQQSNNYEAAGDLLRSQFNAGAQNQHPVGSDNKQQARERLFQAALYYEQAGNRNKALDTFRQYAHAYPYPLAPANEARFKMSEYYLESGEENKRRFWLDKLIKAQLELSSSPSQDAEADAGSLSNDTQLAALGTPRSRYLAAMAAMVFAQDADRAFSQIALDLPLNESLQKKQSALTQAINSYDQVMSFGVAQFTTQANYRLANLYSTLAQDLMSSARPDNLSALEQSQYEILLEEQAYPFEEQAIEIHETNAKRAQTGIYDSYVKQSFEALSHFMPVRYNKQELIEELSADDL